MSAQDGGTVTCARHPDFETALACGRCETPICPRCLVYTPGGTRCPDCAQLRRPPMYELAAADYARAVGVAAVVAAPLGFAGALLFPPSPAIGLFSLLFALLAGSGTGSLVAAAITRATRGKRGTPMQAIAAGAIVLAAVLRLVLAGAPWDLLLRDIAGALLVVIAVSVASSRLR